MASIWKHPESQYWIACFRDANGRQRRLSTRETDRKKAQTIALEYEKTARTRRTLRQTRKAIERLHEEIAGEPIPQKTLRTYVAEWLGLTEYCQQRGIILHRSGHNWSGKCPLHQERHGQSFVIFDDRWTCFGKCSRRGDVIDLEQALPYRPASGLVFSLI